MNKYIPKYIEADYGFIEGWGGITIGDQGPAGIRRPVGGDILPIGGDGD